MEKRTFLLSTLLFIVVAAFGQRNLEVKDISTGLNVFSGKDTEAGVVVSCPSNLELTFESSHDKKVDVFNKEVKGEQNYYYLRFNTGRKYVGRKLFIRTQGYSLVVIPIELNPKELKEYQLIDPDVEFVYGCYYEYRKRGTEFFQNSMYSEAKEQYSIAKECSDCPPDANLDELIANIDSIVCFQEQAEEAFALLKYDLAEELYSKILQLNPLDENASTRRNECKQMYNTDCKKYFDMAEIYKEDGEYEKALELYQKVLDANCTNALLASEEVKNIRLLLQSRRQRSHVLLYEYSKTAPVGISYGSYKNKKTGRYFNFTLHPDLFFAIRNDFDKCRKAEFSITPLGWTVNPVHKYPYCWIVFGLGYTGVCRYETEDGEIYQPGSFVEGAEGEDETVDEPKFKVYSAISPELGITLKVWHFAIRYTFQYRFAVSKKYADVIDEQRHAIGVGFCF